MADVDHIPLRVPSGMRAKLKEIAVRNRRSMNSEIVFHLERVIDHALQNPENPVFIPETKKGGAPA